MGVNKLNSVIKTMANKAGLDEKRRFMNHSAMKMMVQKLNDSNVPPTHIMQLSGHRNMQSVNNYSFVSKEQQKNLSLIMSSKPSTYNAASDAINNASRTAATTTTLTAEAEASFIKTSMFPAAGPFSGSAFHGGQFNITINTVNKSPGTCADGSIATNEA